VTQIPDTPNFSPLIETNEEEKRDSGVPSTVAIAGHPLHPLIVTFPIAFLASAPISDLAYWWTKDMFWAQASWWLILIGLGAAVLAAITGMLDFLRIERVRKRSAGWAHMILNISSMILTIINLLLRSGNISGAILPLGLVLSIVVAALLGLSGWFGAELVFRHKVAVIGYGDPNR